MTKASMVEADEQVELIRKWLLGRERNAGMTEIDMDLDLIDARVLDSLDFLNFVHLLEEITSRELQIDAESANVFRTLRSIRDNLLATQTASTPPSSRAVKHKEIPNHG